MEFSEKVAVITGAAGNIGYAIAEALGKEGARLVLIDQDEDGLCKMARQLKLTDENCLIKKLDITSESEMEKAFHEVFVRFKKINILVNNAGIAGEIKPLQQMSLDGFEKTMRVNVSGVFLGIKYAIPIMIKQKTGSIINISSDAGERGTDSLGDYIASKHAVNGLTKAAAVEGAPFGVRVNTVSPTSTNTTMMKRIMAEEHSEKKFYLRKIPFGRFGETSEIAQVVLFLASDRSSFVTGSIYRVDGGRLSI